jgi:molybdopterin converting factor subunit 1
MRITVRFFAVLRDKTGIGESQIEIEPGSTVASAADALAGTFPAIRDSLPRVAFAVNQEYSKPQDLLREGDELALIPPVSGG